MSQMRRLMLSLLKIRVPWEAILEMEAWEAGKFLDTWSEMTNPGKSKKAIVLRKKRHGDVNSD